MTKINLFPASQTHPSDVDVKQSLQWLGSQRPRHLIVLIPVDSNCALLTRRICKLANETHSTIQLLGLYKDINEEPALRRELVTMSALIRDAKVYVETVIERGTNWVEAIKHNYQTGDILVCVSDQTIGIRRRPLSQILESSFSVPVYLLSEPHKEEFKSSLIAQAIGWAGLIAIIVGFFFIQVRITQLTNDGFQTLLLILFLLPEIWLIQVWNSIFF